MTKIGPKLHRWRTARKLSQAEAAHEAGIAQSAWCDYENDRSLPKADAILRLIALTEGTEAELTLSDFATAAAARARRTRTRARQRVTSARARTGTDG